MLGLENDGTLIQWDADAGKPYTAGETLAEFGEDNLTAAERVRLVTIAAVPLADKTVSVIQAAHLRTLEKDAGLYRRLGDDDKTEEPR